MQAPPKRRFSEPPSRNKAAKSKPSGRQALLSMKNLNTQPKINTFVIKD
jgi:hypothetical protein